MYHIVLNNITVISHFSCIFLPDQAHPAGVFSDTYLYRFHNYKYLANKLPNLLCIILNFEDIYEKLLSEINYKEFDIHNKNTFLHYCVIEHIRLFNTININIQRTVKHDMIYNGIKFKENDQIFILFSSILRNKEEFHNPDYFIPERWENDQ